MCAEALFHSILCSLPAQRIVADAHRDKPFCLWMNSFVSRAILGAAGVAVEGGSAHARAGDGPVLLDNGQVAPWTDATGVGLVDLAQDDIEPSSLKTTNTGTVSVTVTQRENTKKIFMYLIDRKSSERVVQ